MLDLRSSQQEWQQLQRLSRCGCTRVVLLVLAVPLATLAWGFKESNQNLLEAHFDIREADIAFDKALHSRAKMQQALAKAAAFRRNASVEEALAAKMNKTSAQEAQEAKHDWQLALHEEHVASEKQLAAERKAEDAEQEEDIADGLMAAATGLQAAADFEQLRSRTFSAAAKEEKTAAGAAEAEAAEDERDVAADEEQEVATSWIPFWDVIDEAVGQGVAVALEADAARSEVVAGEEWAAGRLKDEEAAAMEGKSEDDFAAAASKKRAAAGKKSLAAKVSKRAVSLRLGAGAAFASAHVLKQRAGAMQKQSEQLAHQAQVLHGDARTKFSEARSEDDAALLEAQLAEEHHQRGVDLEKRALSKTNAAGFWAGVALGGFACVLLKGLIAAAFAVPSMSAPTAEAAAPLVQGSRPRKPKKQSWLESACFYCLLLASLAGFLPSILCMAMPPHQPTHQTLETRTHLARAAQSTILSVAMASAGAYTSVSILWSLGDYRWSTRSQGSPCASCEAVLRLRMQPFVWTFAQMLLSVLAMGFVAELKADTVAGLVSTGAWTKVPAALLLVAVGLAIAALRLVLSFLKQDCWCREAKAPSLKDLLRRCLKFLWACAGALYAFAQCYEILSQVRSLSLRLSADHIHSPVLDEVAPGVQCALAALAVDLLLFAWCARHKASQLGRDLRWALQ